MVQAKMMQQIAFLIMMYGTGYVASIRNGAGSSSSGSGIQDNYASSDPTNSMSSNFFPSQPMMMTIMSELLQPAARQNEYSFRPSQLLEFTPSDATTASQNYPNYVDAQYPQTTQSDVQFTFPSQRQPSSDALFNNNNYHTNTQSNKLSPEIPTQLQSTPILSYRDPYTNENYYHTPAPAAAAASTNRQEFTVHSSMLVHNHRYDTPTYQQQQQHVVPPLAATATFPSQSYAATPPASFGTSSYYTPQYSSHKYETPQYNQRPNALPPVGFDREEPVVLPAQRPTTPPKRISYDSKDYPPPSYYQTSNYLPQPQRQEFSTSSSSSSLHSSSVPNYANNNNNNNKNYNNNNNLGNYLQGEQYPQQQQQHYQQQTQSGNYNSRPPSYTTNTQYPPSSYPSTLMRPQYQPSRGGPPQSPPPTYNNYYEYQQGEIPPAPPSYRPPYRPSSYPQQSSSALPDGLASLASLFTSTQQYAPQFSNLLFGGGGGGGGGSSTNALGSLLGAFAGGNGGGGAASRPVNMQLIKALENIARNDDLQCVPKVLCQMIAGQTQRGQLPEFVTSPAITNFLSAFPAASPALIYGRAALLGISGGVRSCVQTYGQCPKNEDEILYYLNNHRGGFFKFFSEPEPEKQKPQQTTSAADSSSSLFSILAALTGGGGGNTAAAPATTPRPRPRPTAAASADISDGIGSFFTNVLSNYLGGVEYQRRRRRSLDSTDFGDNEKEIEQEKDADGSQDDEEDDEDTQYADDESEETSAEDAATQYDDDAVEGRILNKEISALGAKFFPEAEKAAKIRDSLIAFNKEKASRNLKFPSATTSREYEDAKFIKQDHRGGKEINFKDIEDFDAVQTHHVNFIDNEQNHDDDDEDGDIYKKRRGKMVRFQDDDDDLKNTKFSTIVHDIADVGGKVRFPNSYEEIIRKGRILNRPAYAGGYADYVRNQDDDQDKLVVSDNKRRPHYQSSNFPSSAGNDNNYSAQTYAANSNRYENSAYLSNNQNGNYHQPSKDSYPRYEYPNNNFANSNRYGAGGSNSYNQQHAVVRTTRSPYEDDKNVYVTNSQGTTEYYIRPDGRKVYL